MAFEGFLYISINKYIFFSLLVYFARSTEVTKPGMLGEDNWEFLSHMQFTAFYLFICLFVFFFSHSHIT